MSALRALRHLVAVAGAAVALALGGLPGSVAAQPSAPVLEVWKTPTCGCCNKWIEHMKANGFNVKAYNVADTSSIRARLGMPERLGACHTAKVNGYVVEGHVPAREVKRMLREKPDAVGIAVPEMPMGSPGMEQGGQKDPYDVLMVSRDGRTRVYQSYQ
jgi:hypothetical protein